MPQPRDITSELYRKKRKSDRGSAQISPSPTLKMRRVHIDSFSLVVGMLLGGTLFSQLILLGLFSWI